MREKNPNSGKWIQPSDYKNIGWQISGKEPEVVKCRELGHKKEEFDNSLFKNRYTDLVSYCPICKYCYHTDMSD